MSLGLVFKRCLTVVMAGLILTACATQKKQSGKMQGDVYHDKEKRYVFHY